MLSRSMLDYRTYRGANWMHSPLARSAIIVLVIESEPSTSLLDVLTLKVLHCSFHFRRQYFRSNTRRQRRSARVQLRLRSRSIERAAPILVPLIHCPVPATSGFPGPRLSQAGVS